MPNGWRCCSIMKPPIAMTDAWHCACAMPGCATRPCPRTSITALPRGLDRRLFHKLLKGDWIDAHENLAIIGPTGVGKSWLACALGHKACRDNRSVLYTRLPRLIDELALARGDGRIAARMKSLARVDLLILDDWGLEPLDGNARHDLLEILEDRYGRRSTIVTSQLPVARWHEMIGDPTYADAISDRLVHNAHGSK